MWLVIGPIQMSSIGMTIQESRMVLFRMRALGPDIFVPDAIASGPGHSLTTIFGRTTYSADTITLTFADARPERNIDFSQVSPLTVPVRKAATTFIAMGSVDNKVTPMLDGLCAAGWSPLPCDAQAPGVHFPSWILSAITAKGGKP